MLVEIIGLGGKCLDIKGPAKANGTPIILYTRHGGLNQQWELDANRNLITPYAPGKCLCVEGLSANNGDRIIFSDIIIGGRNQKWNLNADGTLTSDLNPDRCIDVDNAIDENGRAIILWEKNGGINQKWRLYNCEDVGLNGRSIAAIPPSDVWPPRYTFQNDPFKDIPKLKKWEPLNVASSIEKIVDGWPVRLVELCGWLTGVSGEANNHGEDWHYNLELDPAWLDRQGIDFNQICKVGNILGNGDRSPEVCVGKLQTHIELNGWHGDVNPAGTGPGGTGRPLHPLYRYNRPDGWQTFDADPTNAPNVFWAFNPKNPLKCQPPLEVGQYVRMVGSLVTDEPHPNGDDLAANEIKRLWNGPIRNPWDPANPARWTEMHPPDIISVLAAPSAKPKIEEVVTVAICVSDIINPVRTLDCDLVPAAPRPSSFHKVQVTELVGSESNISTIVAGKRSATGSGFSGALITDMGDRAHMSISISSRIGVTGLFKAIYRVKWVPPLQRVPHEMNASISPFPINVQTAATFTVKATDKDLGTLVNAAVYYNKINIGSANTRITYTFKTVRTKHITIEKDSRGRPRQVIEYTNDYLPLELRMPGYTTVIQILF